MMRDSIPGEELLRKASAIGQYYGFTPLTMLTASPHATQTKIKTDLQKLDSGADPVADTISSFLKQFKNTGRMPSARQPLFVWHTNIAPGRAVQKKITVQFHALGTDRAIADTVVIRALLALSRDLFHEDPVVRINSMGDKETRARYARELGNFFKKRASILSEECLACAKQDVFLAAEHAITHGFTDELPSPTEHLSDASRKRFEDLLEYLEMTETPYELARHLISRGGVWSDICFEIMIGEKQVAWGSRYTDLVRTFFTNGSFPATGAVLHIAGEGAVVKKIPHSRLRFSFVHIGDEAKRLSIRLAESFKKEHVPLTQNIGVESLTEQLHLAEKQKSPYLLIIGRKEALENTAIVRNCQTREETILPLDGIIERLKAFA
jgi:histidyl-tRNA synthetase